MKKLQTLKVLEDELGEVLKSGTSRESLYYSAHWKEIFERAAKVAKEQGRWEPNDVRLAYYALDLLGIPNRYSEADQDDEGNWIVYWR